MSGRECFIGCELVMSKEYQELSIKTIPFDGKKENFLIWIEKFKAKALQKARLDILTNVEKIPKKTDYKDAKKKTGSDRTADIKDTSSDINTLWQHTLT